MHPILIATAALVGLPILLHLLMKQEPQKLLFPALRLLRNKQKTNQRKLRIRHWLLLALRMILIAGFGIALYQPTLLSDGGILRGEQPVAAVLIIDMSPSMGYRVGTVSRLDEARRRMLELLDELPAESRIAVIDPNDPAPGWELTAADARTKIESLKEPSGAAVPMTTSLTTAYQLLKTIDQESENAEPLPRFVAIFTDRTTGCWDATRNEDLIPLRDAIPKPAVVHAVFEVGIDQPANVGIVGAEMKPQIIAANQPALITVTVQASGPEVSTAVVRAKLDDSPNVERRQVPRMAAGSTAAVTFEFVNQPRGFHRVEFSLETEDNLMADNVRYLTFQVAEPRKILTICDDPNDAAFWSLAHEVKGEFECTVLKPDEVKSLSGYDAVCLLNVADPAKPQTEGGSLWDRVKTYLNAGGKVIVMPGANARITAYDAKTFDFLPGSLKTIIKTVNLEDPENKRYYGVSWSSDDADLKHPMLSEYVKWKRQANLDIIKNPRKAWQYWDVEPANGGVTVVPYDDADDKAKRHPAILERSVGEKGKLLLFTTRYDPQNDRNEAWNDTWLNNNWAVAFPHQILLYLAGRTSEARFNYLAGDSIPVLLPTSPTPIKRVRLSGPGVTSHDADIEVTEQQKEIRLPAARTTIAGNFILAAGPARVGYSVNIASEESSLVKVDVPVIEAVTLPQSVIPVDKTVKFRELMDLKFNQPMNLFPLLMVLILLLLAIEGVVANRFYRKG
ncbi:MAG: BatA and WFA domain-containing protein [Gemmataceae bacterium]